MFERFTERARKVMTLADEEAQRFNHEYIGTEHVLLGLIKEGAGVGANVLKIQGVDLQKIRVEVEKQSSWGGVSTEYLDAKIIEGNISVFSLDVDLPVTARMVVEAGTLRAKMGECDLILKRVQ